MQAVIEGTQCDRACTFTLAFFVLAT